MNFFTLVDFQIGQCIQELPYYAQFRDQVVDPVASAGGQCWLPAPDQKYPAHMEDTGFTEENAE